MYLASTIQAVADKHTVILLTESSMYCIYAVNKFAVRLLVHIKVYRWPDFIFCLLASNEDSDYPSGRVRLIWFFYDFHLHKDIQEIADMVDELVWLRRKLASLKCNRTGFWGEIKRGSVQSSRKYWTWRVVFVLVLFTWDWEIVCRVTFSNWILRRPMIECGHITHEITCSLKAEIILWGRHRFASNC